MSSLGVNGSLQITYHYLLPKSLWTGTLWCDMISIFDSISDIAPTIGFSTSSPVIKKFKQREISDYIC